MLRGCKFRGCKFVCDSRDFRGAKGDSGQKSFFVEIMNQLKFLKTLAILNGLVPLLVLAWDAYHGQLGANSVNYALHVTGILTLIFLFLSLMMTPLRWVTGWGGWIAFRRALGLYGFFYSIVHVSIYVGLDRAMDLSSTLNEIWMRRFLQIGTAAVFLMVPLALTSTNSMIQKVGPKRWKLLHRLAYLVAGLGVLHYFLLVKSDVRQPLAFAAVLTGLLGARFGWHYFELRKAAKNSISHSAKSNPKSKNEKPKYWSGELTLAATFRETPDVQTFRLVAKDGGPLPFDYRPGQYMNLQLTIEGKRVNRSYTIASSPTRRDACELSIKREHMGLSSRYLHDALKVGDSIKVSAPAGKFVFTGSEAPAVLLVAGGVGITPLMSIVRYLTDRVWSGEIYFLVIAKTERDIIFHDELHWLKARFPRLHICITLTRTEPESMWQGDRGRANAALLKRFVPNLTQVPAYLCGPNEMMDSTRELLMSVGIPSEQIKTEAFVSPVGNAEIKAVPLDLSSRNGKLNVTAKSTNVTSGSKTKTLTFARSNLDVEISDDQSILEAAEEAGIEIPYECRSGICGQCKSKILKGIVEMDSEDALSPAEKTNGFILACQSHLRSHVTIDA